MKKILSIILFFQFAGILCYAQNLAKILTLNPIVDEMISKNMCENYSILENYGNFSKAIFNRTRQNEYYGKFFFVQRDSTERYKIKKISDAFIFNLAKKIYNEEKLKTANYKLGTRIHEPPLTNNNLITERDTALYFSKSNEVLSQSELSAALEEKSDVIGPESFPKFSAGIGVGFENAEYGDLKEAFNKMELIVQQSHFIESIHSDDSYAANPFFYFSFSVSFNKYIETVTEYSISLGDITAHVSSVMILFDFEMNETRQLILFAGGGISNYSFYTEKDYKINNLNSIIAEGSVTGAQIAGGLKVRMTDNIKLWLVIARSFRPDLDTTVGGTDIHAAVDLNNFSFGLRLFFDF